MSGAVFSRGSRFSENLRQSGWFSFSSALLFFPLTTVLLAALGLLAGIRVNAGCAVVGILAALAAAWLSPEKGRGVLRAAGAIAGLIGLNGLAVMYASADADLYHLPAVRMLAAGWNPLQCGNPAALAQAFPELAGSRLAHVAFLPKGSWLFGAAMMRLLGYADAGNVLAMLLAAALFPVLRALLAQCFQLEGRWGSVMALTLTFSPALIDNLFDATNDGSLYALLLLSAASAQLFLKSRENRWLLLALLPLPLLANLKFSGAAACAVIGLTGLVAGGGRRWFTGCALAACGALLIGAVSYLPQWREHGSPVYPLFEKDLPAAHNLTADFGELNADAAEMGYLGRFSYAYLSSFATKTVYRLLTGRPDFNPELRIAQGGMNGLGPVFCSFMVLGVIGWCISGRRREHWPLAAMLLASALLQPTAFVGYARYVPQLYAFAVLGELTIKMPRSTLKYTLCLQIAICIVPIAWLAWKGMLSLQNLAVIAAFGPGEAALETPYPNIREGFREYGIVCRPHRPDEIKTVTSGSMLYTVWRSPEMPDPGIPSLRTGFDAETEYLKPRTAKLIQNAADIPKTVIPWVIRSTPRLSLTLLEIRLKQLFSTPPGDRDAGPPRRSGRHHPFPKLPTRGQKEPS